MKHEINYGTFKVIPKGGGWWDVVSANGDLMYAWVAKNAIRNYRDTGRLVRF